MFRWHVLIDIDSAGSRSSFSAFQIAAGPLGFGASPSLFSSFAPSGFLGRCDWAGFVQPCCPASLLGAFGLPCVHMACCLAGTGVAPGLWSTQPSLVSSFLPQAQFFLLPLACVTRLLLSSLSLLPPVRQLVLFGLPVPGSFLSPFLGSWGVWGLQFRHGR